MLTMLVYGGGQTLSDVIESWTLMLDGCWTSG
jgi:hypothetical protein